MLRTILGLALLAGLAPSLSAAEPTAGNWKVQFAPLATLDVVDGIVKLEKKGDKWAAELVTSSPRLRNVAIDKFAIDGDKVNLVFKAGPTELSFEGKVAGEKSVIGNYFDGRRLYPARMVWTEDTELNQQSSMVRRSPPAPMQEMQKLQSAVMQARTKLRNAKDDDEKKQLTEEMAARSKELDETMPKLLRKVLADHADDVAVFEATNMLLTNAAKSGATMDDARGWVAKALAQAEAYGPRFRRETAMSLAEAAGRVATLKPLAVDLAKKSESELGANAPTADQIRVLTILAVATPAGDPAAKGYADRLEKLEAKLDEEYLAKHAKFPVDKYEGRKDGGNRVVLLELFTGAQCPPCVAADVAFDKMEEAYTGAEVIRLQYHLHIPGPDPLTNSDTEARWNYYRKAYPDGVGGTPTTIFNGAPKAGGGGPESAAPRKLADYRKVIDPVLNEKTAAKINLKAVRTGDDIKIAAAVDLPEAGDNHKLRFALIEDVVRYPGGNGLRFHHHVVRALPGGADGFAVTGKSESRQVAVNVADLRGRLTKYLDETSERMTYPKPNRPMDLKKLKAVAWVQNDETHEVITAVEVDVTEGNAG